MDFYGVLQSIFEVEYFEEVGIGFGLIFEFYLIVFKEFFKKKFKLWCEMDFIGLDEFVSVQNGFFFCLLSDEEVIIFNGEWIFYFFKMLGKFVVWFMFDFCIIDLYFSFIFF